MMKTPLLEIKDLHISFPLDEGNVQAVSGVNLTIYPGQVMGVVGESGCGKTVTAQSLLRIIPPPGRIDSGQILFRPSKLFKDVQGDGIVDLAALKSDDERLRKIRGNEIAMIFQEPMSSFSPVHTIGAQIAEAVQLHLHLDAAATRKHTLGMLRMVGIPSPELRIDTYAHQLSGGLRQRAMIAMALACRPRLLIADEPTTALDVTVQAQILELLRQLQEQMRMSVLSLPSPRGPEASWPRGEGKRVTPSRSSSRPSACSAR